MRPAVRPDVRRQELRALRDVPLGNALFTRDSFEAEYGPAEFVSAPTRIDLGGADPTASCIYCDGDRFVAETYATDTDGVHVEFRWCEGCGLGHAVAWGATVDLPPEPSPA
jgi:hypothetical protein